MLHKTRGIVLKSTNYSETSIVVQVFTEKFGTQSYLVNGARKPRARLRANLFQPLSLLDMVVYHKTTTGLQRISEARVHPFYEYIPYDIIKSSLLMFINELSYKLLRHHDADDALFDFIFHSLEILDHTDSGVANFHLWYALRLSRYLGFKPEDTSGDKLFFDLKEGAYTNLQPIHPHYFQGDLKLRFYELQNAGLAQFGTIAMNAHQRNELMRGILDFYRFRIDDFGEIHSLAVLHEILHS